ncbi:hypothetical protein FOA52_011433 [Chlamydomonas sp. UWO 241]|nr:hypothetical protein FOA52_011433 [Chlamydomonas sp. UWO 241]
MDGGGVAGSWDAGYDCDGGRFHSQSSSLAAGSGFFTHANAAGASATVGARSAVAAAGASAGAAHANNPPPPPPPRLSPHGPAYTLVSHKRQHQRGRQRLPTS